MTLSIQSAKIIGFPAGEITAGSASFEIDWLVYSSAPAPGHLVAEAAANSALMPSINEYLGQVVEISMGGETYTDSQLFCTTYRHRNTYDQDRMARRHILTGVYETAEAASGSVSTSDPNALTDPLDRPIERTVEFIVEQEEITQARNLGDIGSQSTGTLRKDNTLQRMTNSAGFPIREKYYRTVRRPVFVMRKYVSSFEKCVTLNEDWQNTINSAEFFGIPKHKAAFLQADVTGPTWYNGLARYQLTVKVGKRKDGWDLKVLNVGSEYIDDEFNTKTITDADGIPIRDAVLNAEGRPHFGGLSASDLVDGTEPWTLNYRYLEPKDYDALTEAIDNYR